MIIACPACGTRYAVPDAAIGNEGRTVRCAKCKHSWFQDSPELDLGTMPRAPVAEPRPAPPSPATPAPERAAPPAATVPPVTQRPAPEPEAPSEGPSVSHWRTPDASHSAGQSAGQTSGQPSGYSQDAAPLAMRALRRGLAPGSGEAESPAPAAVAPPTPAAPPPPPPAPPVSGPVAEDDFADPPFADDDGGYDDDADGGSQFDYRAPFTQARNPLKMWTLAVIIFAALAGGTAFAVNQYGLPEWLPLQRPTFGIGQPGLKLDFPAAENRKDTLENGETIFRVRGTISNTASESLDVPDVLVVFSDRRDRNVGDWVVAPSQRRLAPGESLTVTEAITNIPSTAAGAAIGWAPR